MRKGTRLALVGLAGTAVLCAAAYGQAPCALALPPLQPEEPLELDVVITAESQHVKVTKVEKEVFLCDAGARIRDVNIYTQLYQDMERPRLAPKFRIEAILCDKIVDTGSFVDCTIKRPPPLPPGHIVGSCQPDTERGTIRDPVALDVEGGPRDRLKSVHVEKEIFNCFLTDPTGAQLAVIKDVNIITEIVERIHILPGAILIRWIWEVACIKDPGFGEVLFCDVREIPLR